MGAARFIEATNTQVMGPGDQWRFNKALGLPSDWGSGRPGPL
jgi:hypothetical protein